MNEQVPSPNPSIDPSTNLWSSLNAQNKVCLRFNYLSFTCKVLHTSTIRGELHAAALLSFLIDGTQLAKEEHGIVELSLSLSSLADASKIGVVGQSGEAMDSSVFAEVRTWECGAQHGTWLVVISGSEWEMELDIGINSYTPHSMWQLTFCLGIPHLQLMTLDHSSACHIISKRQISELRKKRKKKHTIKCSNKFQIFV